MPAPAADSERLSRFTFKRRERKSGRQIGSLDSHYIYRIETRAAVMEKQSRQ
jgi:hypothetical protein